MIKRAICLSWTGMAGLTLAVKVFFNATLTPPYAYWHRFGFLYFVIWIRLHWPWRCTLQSERLKLQPCSKCHSNSAFYRESMLGQQGYHKQGFNHGRILFLYTVCTILPNKRPLSSSEKPLCREECKSRGMWAHGGPFKGVCVILSSSALSKASSLPSWMSSPGFWEADERSSSLLSVWCLIWSDSQTSHRYRS